MIARAVPPPSAFRLWTIAKVGACALVSVLPVFLYGAMAGPLGEELGLREVHLGLAGGAFFASSGLIGVPAGRTVARLGSNRVMNLALAVSTISLVGLALMTGSFYVLLFFLVAAGAGNALSQTSTSAALLTSVPVRRYGVAFGMKQLNGPIASVIASGILAYVVIWAELGWRGGFAAAAGLALVLLATFSRRGLETDKNASVRAGPPPRGSVERSPELVGLFVASSMGAAVAAVLASFFVVSLLRAGVPSGKAATLLSIAGGAGVTGRLFWGWVSDRHLIQLHNLLAFVFGTGALSVLALAHTRDVTLLVVVTACTFATAGSWPGLLIQRGATLNPSRAPATVGMLMVGIGGGGALGPPAFGLVADTLGYRSAWLGTAGALAVATLALAAVGSSTGVRPEQTHESGY